MRPSYRLGFVLLILFFSCQSNFKSLSDFLEYVSNPDNGLIKEQDINSVKADIVYRPTDLLVHQEILNKENVSNSIIDSLRKSYRSKAFFVLSLSRNNQEIEQSFLHSELAYSQVIQYLTSEIASRIEITTDEPESIPLLGHSYIRMYGGTGKSSMLLVFDREKITKGKSFKLIVHDDKLGIGTFHFTFRAKDLTNIPSLLFEV